jgi:S-DNA-T family DNA segregation ATPase FtsK/SpoIIIE
MPKRTASQATSKSKRKRKSTREEPETVEIDPHVRKEIKVILLIVAALVIFLGLINAAGAAGRALDTVLASFFGLNKYLVPLILLGLAGHIAWPEKYELSLTGKIGLVMLLVSWGGLVNLFLLKTPAAMLEIGDLAGAGGYAGLLISYPLVRLAEFWGAAVILVGLAAASVMLAFSISLRQAGSFLYYLPSRVRARFSGEEYDEDEEYEYDEDEEEEDEGEEEEDEESPAFKSRPMEPGDEADLPSTAGIMNPFPRRRRLTPISMPFDLLEHKNAKPTSGDIHGRSMTIRKTLENFGIPVEMGDVSVGPTVTQFTLKPADGIKLSRITSLSNDLALSLAAHPIRIEAPIPGKPLVGIEVPNQAVAIVGLREVLESSEFQKQRKSSLTVCLGKDVSGKPWVADLGRMPHLLVAGATGSGKTVCLNSIILSLLYQNNPEDLRFLLIDPKRVELPVYNGIPHMLVPAVTDVPKTINSLKWCIEEMDRRFSLLSDSACRDIASYNRQARGDDRLPYIVVIIDELADLMVAAASEVEASIIRLAQMARAVGIHLVVATQRPSVDVITGLIKANIINRIAFSVASSTDSRTILDCPGAEKLVGRGDSLFQTPDLSKPKRIQCCYVGDADIRRVVDHIVGQLEEPVDYVSEVTEKKHGGGAFGGGFSGGDDDDELLDEAKMTVIKAGKASASYLQRRLKIGYARAARLLDLLEERGIIGPGDGAKPREILVSPVEDVDGYHLPDDDE